MIWLVLLYAVAYITVLMAVTFGGAWLLITLIETVSRWISGRADETEGT